ncbi:hypothetical protein JOM56_008848 [Amanita muscaria]
MGGGILFIVAKKLSLPAGERESSELMVSGGGENVGWASPEEIVYRPPSIHVNVSANYIVESKICVYLCKLKLPNRRAESPGNSRQANADMDTWAQQLSSTLEPAMADNMYTSGACYPVTEWQFVFTCTIAGMITMVNVEIGIRKSDWTACLPETGLDDYAITSLARPGQTKRNLDQYAATVRDGFLAHRPHTYNVKCPRTFRKPAVSIAPLVDTKGTAFAIWGQAAQQRLELEIFWANFTAMFLLLLGTELGNLSVATFDGAKPSKGLQCPWR